MKMYYLFADGIFNDISYFAIVWWILLIISVFLGLIFTIYELAIYFKKREEIPKTERIGVTFSHSLLFGTIVAYGILSRYESIDGFSSTPTLLALLLATFYFFILQHYKHSPKSHYYSLLLIIIISLIFWILSNN